jgi:hypothetical protein
MNQLRLFLESLDDGSDIISVILEGYSVIFEAYDTSSNGFGVVQDALELTLGLGGKNFMDEVTSRLKNVNKYKSSLFDFGPMDAAIRASQAKIGQYVDMLDTALRNGSMSNSQFIEKIVAIKGHIQGLIGQIVEFLTKAKSMDAIMGRDFYPSLLSEFDDYNYVINEL